MENVSHAIFLSFAMFALVIGLSFSIYLLNTLNSTASALIQATDKTNEYQSVSFDSSNVLNRGNLGKIGETLTTRTVTVDTVISTLYRYTQENFSVEIYDNSNRLVQIFDLEVEGVIRNKNESNPTYNAYHKLYDQNSYCRLYEAPWITDEDIKQRIDLYVSSQKGYIKEKLVDYSKNGENDCKGLSNLIQKGTMFTERFIQYAYSGDVFTETNGDDTESIIEGSRPLKKIIIQYIQQ